MPLTLSNLDNRRYQELVDEALARIPVHTPEWTNFNQSDPGVTLIQLFAFMTEALLYRFNQFPDRNRRKFLSLLGVPLRTAAPARGLVTFTNERGELKAITLNDGLEARAGSVPFRTTLGLDVLPIEAAAYYKRQLPQTDQRTNQLLDYYRQLYASHLGGNPPADPVLYETVLFDPTRDGSEGVLGFGQDDAVIGQSLWLALLLRQSDAPYDEARREEARRALAGKTINLGVVPYLENASRDMLPGRPDLSEAQAVLRYELPSIALSPDDTARLPRAADGRPNPSYGMLSASTTTNVLLEPGIVQITLPGDWKKLRLWEDVDPLEAGVDEMPPALDDSEKADRLITWLRIRASAGARFKLTWIGINATPIEQRAHISNELLGEGTGEPDQVFTLARPPVVSGSVRLSLTTPEGIAETWEAIDDLLAAGPEVSIPNPRLPPGAPPPPNPRVNVFTLNPESGELRFGDGTRGRRPPLGAVLRATYAYTEGWEGNIGPSAINTGPALPVELKVTNPVRTWGGVDAETVAEGEKQIARYLQHRDRLVTRADFETIVRRTPGVEIGRVDVLPAYHPDLSEAEDDTPGAVTLLLLPKSDPAHPERPAPDQLFLNAVCDYLDARRLITTQLYLRGPNYQPIWVSIGITVELGYSIAQAQENVRWGLYDFLSPFTWPLRKTVIDREIMAVASRQPGVQFVKGVYIARGDGAVQPDIPMTGLQLPYLRGLAVEIGMPLPLDQLRGRTDSDVTTVGGQDQAAPRVPVPIIPEECR